jgi:polysaccharide pyruvyl transferase WcaK-like protein
MTERREMPGRPVRVAVFGHVGQDNLGDEAAFKAVIEATKSRRPSAEIVGISVNPADTAFRYGIRTFPIWRDTPSTGSLSEESTKVHKPDRGQTVSDAEGVGRLKCLIRSVPGLFPLLRSVVRVFAFVPVVMRELLFLWRTYRMLRHVDLLAVAGSQHLNDYVLGPWNFPYTLFKWTILAKLGGAKVAFLNVGAGPLQTSLGKWFIKQAVIWSDFQSYRDESSVRCIKELGVQAVRPSLPDMVFSLYSGRKPLTRGEGGADLVVGVNPIPFNSADYWVGGNQENYERYIHIMASFARWVLGRGCKVVFFPTQLTLDPRVIRDVMAQIDMSLVKQGRVVEASIKSIEDLSAAIALMDIVVASRFHGLIFSMLHEKPVLGIAYAEKTRDLMTYMGQADHVLGILELNLSEMQRCFCEIESHREQIGVILRQKTHECRQAVEAEFDEAFSLLGTIAAH